MGELKSAIWVWEQGNRDISRAVCGCGFGLVLESRRWGKVLEKLVVELIRDYREAILKEDRFHRHQSLSSLASS